MKQTFKKSITLENEDSRSDVHFNRWTKYGKDRVYVSYGSKHHSAGYIDLMTEEPTYICDDEYDRSITTDCVDKFLSTYTF